MAKEAIKNSYSVVVDATNFRSERWESVSINNGLKPTYQDFTDVPIETCIERDKNRPKEEQVGEAVIVNMYNKYLKNETI